MPKSFTARLVAVLSLLLAVALGVYALANRHAATPEASNPAAVGGAFTLTDQFGKPRSDAEFRGKLMLVYFGFTNCPDVCPLALQKMTDALDALGDKAAGIVPIFITVDPARDTVEAMRDYAANFHPSLVALTGDKAAAEAAARAYRVYAEAGDAAGSADYNVAHSSIVYLMGRDGGYVTHFGDGASAEEMAQRLAEEL
jgi:protein SCO1/2